MPAAGGGSGRSAFDLVQSFASRDTFPESQRGLDVNIIGRLMGRDPVLKDSAILIDAHFDHLGMARAPLDADSVQAWQTVAAPIRRERDAWFKTSGLAARAETGVYQMTESEKTTMTAFSARLAALRVNMDSIHRVHPAARLDSVFNGADDDATGVVAVIEA